MTRSEWATGSAIFLAAIVAGFFSAPWADRHFAHQDVEMPSATSAACVGKDGSWKNWVWANVPALSPNCETTR
jgi:hypothetical protein